MNAPVHGHTVGGKNSPTMMSWLAMRARCNNPKSEKYPDYGGRGIRVCDRWQNDFAAFLADMGERPEGKTLDRFPDRDGNYEPNNCRWATAQEQSENRDKTNLGWKARRAACPHGHEFTAENTHIRPDGSRQCRTCARATAERKRARRREQKNAQPVMWKAGTHGGAA